MDWDKFAKSMDINESSSMIPNAQNSIDLINWVVAHANFRYNYFSIVSSTQDSALMTFQ